MALGLLFAMQIWIPQHGTNFETIDKAAFILGLTSKLHLIFVLKLKIDISSIENVVFVSAPKL